MRTFGTVILGCLLWSATAFGQGATCGGATTCTGNIRTNGDAVTMTVQNSTGSVYVSTTGTWTGTLSFKSSGDCANYSSVTATDGVTTTTTVNGAWRFNASALCSFEVTATATMTGQAAIRINQAPGSAASGPPAPFSVTTAQLLSGTYTSGISATGSTNQTCVLTFAHGGIATVALTGTNTIAGSTALVITAPGSGFTSAPTTATASAGTAASCTGTPVLATVLTGADLGGLYGFLYNPAGPITYSLPAGVPGWQRCYRNATGSTGVITIAVATSNSIDLSGVNGTTSTGTLVSGGALGDAMCLESDVTNHWYAYTSSGTWTNN